MRIVSRGSVSAVGAALVALISTLAVASEESVRMMRVIEKPEDLATVYADAQSAVTYDSMTGRFYYPSLGLYFDPTTSLFYDPATGLYRDQAIAGTYAPGYSYAAGYTVDGLYYDVATGLYYDPLKKMAFDPLTSLYHDEESGLALSWDSELNAFYDPVAGAYYDRTLGTYLIYDQKEQKFFDTEKGRFYDSELGLYYDKSLGLFFDPLQNRYYDKETGEYCDPATGTRTVDAAGHLQFDDDAGYYFCDLDGHYYSYDMGMGLYLSCDYGTCGFRLYYDSQTCHHIVYDAMGCFYYEQETGSVFDPMTGRYYENSTGTYYSYDAMRAEFVDEMTGAAYLPGNSMTCYYDQDLISISDGPMMGYGENATGLYYIWQIGLFFDGTCYYFDLERNITYYLDPLNGRYYDIETGLAYMTPPPNGGGWSSFSVDVSSMFYDEMYGMYYDAMTGRYYDDMLGLYYDGMSYYDPQTGNWCGFDMERGCYCDSITGKAFLPIRRNREAGFVSSDSGMGHVDMSNMTYDEMMGMYYDNSRCCYYDDTVGLFYDGMSYFDQAGHYYWYDSMLNRYYDQMTGETFIPPSQNGSNGIDVSNMTYDEMWGMYYDSTLGYYYNAQVGLYFDGMSYYDPNTWRCYWYDSMCNRYYDSMTGEEFVPQASAGSNRLNLANMRWDDMYGMYYDPSTGYYFDATVNLYFDGMVYYDPQTWQCYYYDSMQDCYYDLMTGERYTPRDTVTGMSCDEIVEIQKTFRLLGDVMPYASEYGGDGMTSNLGQKTIHLENAYCVAPFSASDAVWFDRLFSMGMDYSSKRIRLRANGMPLQLEIECQDTWDMSGGQFNSSGLFVEVSEEVWNRATRSVELTIYSSWSSMMGMGATVWNGNSMTYSVVDPRNGMYSSTVGIEGVDSEADFAAFAEYAGNWYYDSLFSMAIFRGCWSFGGGMASEYGVPSFASTTTVGGFLDSDGDGLADIDEYGHGTNPFMYDTDGDGLNDALELRIGSCPTMYDSDSDGDGMADVWEGYFHLNAQNPVDANADPDQDGLINRDECFLGTNPLDEDTDGDGLRDGAELKAGTQPLNVDTDNDGLPDGSEIACGTNPLNPDTDLDGLFDGKEVGIGLDPTSVDTDRDGIADSDALLYKLTSAALSSYADQEAARRLKEWLPLDYADVDWDDDLDGVPDYVQYMVGSEPYSGFDVTKGHDGYPAAFILTLTVGEGELKFPGPVCVEIDGQKICLHEAKTLTRWCKEGERHTVRIIAQQGARIPVRATCNNPRYAQHAVVIDDKEGALMNDCQPADLSVYPCKSQHTVRTFDVFQPTVKIKDVICFHGDGENRQMKKTVESEICPKEFEGRVEWTIVEKEKEEGFRVEGDAVNVYRCHVGMTLRCKMTSEDGRLMELERSVVAKIGSCFHQDLDATQDDWCPVHNRAKKICDKLHGCVGFECDAMCQDRRSVGDMKHWDVTERTEPGSNGMTGTPTLEGLPEDGEPFFVGTHASSSVALNADDDNGNEENDVNDRDYEGEDDFKVLEHIVPWAECCKCPDHVKFDSLLPLGRKGVEVWEDEYKYMMWVDPLWIDKSAYIEGTQMSTYPDDAYVYWEALARDNNGMLKTAYHESYFTVYSLRLIPDLNRDGAVDKTDKALVPQMKDLNLGWVVDTEQRHLFNLCSEVDIEGDISLSITRTEGDGRISIFSSADPAQTKPICTLEGGKSNITFKVVNGSRAPGNHLYWLSVSKQGTTAAIEAVYKGSSAHGTDGYECHAKLKVTAPIFQIAGDGGVRDGKIDFEKPEDKNIVFWVNDDCDAVHWEENQFHEDDVFDDAKNKVPNCNDDIIGAVCYHTDLQTTKEYLGGIDWIAKSLADEYDSSKNNLVEYLDDHVDRYGDIGGISAVEMMQELNNPRRRTSVVHYCYRDLEDFDRLHVRIDEELVNLSSLVYEFKFEHDANVSAGKSPSVNIFKAVTPDLSYIEGRTDSDKKMRDLQMKERRLFTITHDDWVALPEGYAIEKLNAFLYEGKSVGTGKLTIKVRMDKIVLAESSITMSLHSAHDLLNVYRNEETTPKGNRDEWNVQVSDFPGVEMDGRQIKVSARAPWNNSETNVVVFVLGWNVKQKEKDAWADMVMKRLFWQRCPCRVIALEWPCLFGFAGSLGDVVNRGPHFDQSEHRAWLSAVKAVPTLTAIASHTKHVTILAHSQGNVLVGELLKRLDDNTKNKITYLPFQAAISAQYYTTAFDARSKENKGKKELQLSIEEPLKKIAGWGGRAWNRIKFSNIPDLQGNFSLSNNGKPYLTNVLANVRTVNFFNRKDYALNIWVMNNCSKPDNLEGVFKHDTSFNYGSSEIVDGGSETRQTQVGFYRHTETLGKLRIDPVGDEWARWCVFSFVTPTRSLAFGQLDMNGVVNRKVSLKDYGYGNDHYGHSRQFRSNITDVFEIWSIVKDEIERPFMPDQNQNVNSVED